MKRATNILLLIMDDLRGDLGCAGLPDAIVPNIRRLQARGMTFTRAHTPCAICAPARASLFSGLSPDTHGVTTLRHKLKDRIPDLLTWPAHLRRRGWHTMRSGKVFHKGVPDCLVDLRDGDDDPDAWDTRLNPAGFELHSNGEYVNLTPWPAHRAGSGSAIAWLKAQKGDSLQHDDRVASDVCEAIASHDRRQPAVWAAGFIRPHVPMVVPKAYFDRVDDLPIPLLVDPPDATPLTPCVTERWCSRFDISPIDRTRAVRAYLASVVFLDRQVGRILDALDASGLSDETIIVLTADHGVQLGEHGLWFKNYLYRESTHIPLMIASPSHASTHGRSCDALVDQADLFPTLMELLDEPSPVAFDGTSLAPLLTRPDDRVRDAHLAQVDWGDQVGRSVRTDAWLYVRWTGAASAEELYDLHADPSEQINLVHTRPDHPALADLRRRLPSA